MLEVGEEVGKNVRWENEGGRGGGMRGRRRGGGE